MKASRALLLWWSLIAGVGCGAGNRASGAPGGEPPPGEVAPPAGEQPEEPEAPLSGTGTRIEASYELGAWGPCDRQRVVYTRDGDDYGYTRVCDDDLSMTAEAITEEQFRQAVFIGDFLAAAGQELPELPAASFPERCDGCTACFRSRDEVLTACQNSSGVISYFFADQARLGKADANKTRWLISYEEQ